MHDHSFGVDYIFYLSSTTSSTLASLFSRSFEEEKFAQTFKHIFSVNVQQA
jgi:ABC-type multidrug transport system permease subunit